MINLLVVKFSGIFYQIFLTCETGVYEIPTEEFVYIPSHESYAEPFGAPLVASFEISRF